MTYAERKARARLFKALFEDAKERGLFDAGFAYFYVANRIMDELISESAVEGAKR